MGNTWIIDIRHLTDCDPTVVLSRAFIERRTYFGHIIQAATAARRAEFLSGIPCRRRPNHEPCTGLIAIRVIDDPEPVIYWLCPLCEDNGRIGNFQGSWYDLGRYSIDTNTDEVRPIAFTREEYAAWISGDLLTYDPISLLLIYAADSDGTSVLLRGPGRYLDRVLGAVAADNKHETKRRRKRPLRSVQRRLLAACGPR